METLQSLSAASLQQIGSPLVTLMSFSTLLLMLMILLTIEMLVEMMQAMPKANAISDALLNRFITTFVMMTPSTTPVPVNAKRKRVYGTFKRPKRRNMKRDEPFENMIM